jgi:hypothetical protein
VARRALAVTLTALAATACEDPNEVFTGRWEATEVASVGLYEGAPLLAIGHYGREVAGVVFFRSAPGGSENTDVCPCAYVDHQRLNLSTREVVFRTDPCSATGSAALDWHLAIVDDDETGERHLEGQVRWADGTPGEESVRLLQTETFVRDEDRICEP